MSSETLFNEAISSVSSENYNNLYEAVVFGVDPSTSIEPHTYKILTEIKNKIGIRAFSKMFMEFAKRRTGGGVFGSVSGLLSNEKSRPSRNRNSIRTSKGTKNHTPEKDESQQEQRIMDDNSRNIEDLKIGYMSSRSSSQSSDSRYNDSEYTESETGTEVETLKDTIREIIREVLTEELRDFLNNNNQS